MTKVVQLHSFGGPEHLNLDNIENLVPLRNEVKIKVESACITRDHYAYMEGSFGVSKADLPLRFGNEVSGIVEEIGENVDPIWLGKHVAPLPLFHQSRYAVLGEEALIPVEYLIEYPNNLTKEEATSFWVPYLTSAYPLTSLVNIEKNNIVTILAAPSSVGLAAIQVAKAEGAIVIAVTINSKDTDDLKKLGADYVISLDKENYVQRINEITNGKGTNVIFDPVGGSMFEQLVESSAVRGKIIVYGLMSKETAILPIAKVISKGLTIHGSSMAKLYEVPDILLKTQKYILKNLQNGVFKPKIGNVFSLENIQEAYSKVTQNNREIGRIVIKP